MHNTNHIYVYTCLFTHNIRLRLTSTCEGISWRHYHSNVDFISTIPFTRVVKCSELSQYFFYVPSDNRTAIFIWPNEPTIEGLHVLSMLDIHMYKKNWLTIEDVKYRQYIHPLGGGGGGWNSTQVKGGMLPILSNLDPVYEINSTLPLSC